MIRVWLAGFLFLGLGALLASGTSWLPLRPGMLGALLMVVGAVWMRQRWAARREAVGDDPSAAERNLWVYYAATALVLGFVALVLMTPGSEVHRNSGDTGGYDSWTMLAGAAVAWALLFEYNAPRDERDRAIDAFSMKVGYYALCTMLLVFLLLLGFAPRGEMKRFTHWLIANTLLSLIMAAAVFQYGAGLLCYARDRAALQRHAEADDVAA